MIIGIGGKLKHGKTTIANILIEKFGYKKISFGDPLKKILSIALKEYFTLDDFYDQQIKDLTFNKYTSYPEIVLTKHQIDRLICAININYNLTSTEMEIIREWFNNEKFTSLRDLMQRFGTDLCRNLINNNIWVDTLQKQLSFNFNNKNNKFISDDIRFLNERKMIHNLNGILILIKRDLPEYENKHSSELSLGEDKEYNIIIDNNSSLDDLKNKIDILVSIHPYFL